MQSINFQTGVWREYAINGDENNTIRVNISDINTVGRMQDIIGQARDMFALLRTQCDPQTLMEHDKALRGLLDEVFGAGFSDRVFGVTNVFTPVGDGEDMLFTAFCTAFTEVLRADAQAYAETRKPEIRPEVQKYLPEQEPAVPDVSALSEEQRRALLAELMK